MNDFVNINIDTIKPFQLKEYHQWLKIQRKHSRNIARRMYMANYNINIERYNKRLTYYRKYYQEHKKININPHCPQRNNEGRGDRCL